MSVATAPTVPLAWTKTVDDAPVALHAAAGTVAVAGLDEGAWVLRGGQLCDRVSLPGGALSVAVSPDGERVAVVGPRGHAIARPTRGESVTTESGAWSAAARWATNDRVAIASGRRALVLDATGTPMWSTADAPSTVLDLLWMRNGRRLALAAYGGVYCHERHTPGPVETYPYLGSHLTLALSASGAWLCSGNQDASIHIWRTRDGDELTMAGYRSKVARIAFDPTGRWLAADGGPEVTVWDFAGKGPAGTAPRVLVAHERITALAWQPGTQAQLASGGSEGVLALWTADAGRPSGQLAPVRAFNLGSGIAALAWASPDLLVLACEDGRIAAVEVPGGPWR